MKHFKKLASLLLATIMVFGLTATALATGNNPGGGDTGGGEQPVTPTYNDMQGGGTGLTGGSITIANNATQQTYNIYQIMYLKEVAGSDPKTYVYKANNAWKDWLNGQTGYVTVGTGENEGTVKWVDGITEAQKAEFAQKALTYATTEGNITANGTSTSSETTHAAVFDELNLGCYLADSAEGVLCELSLDKPKYYIEAEQLYYQNMGGTLIGGKITINNAVKDQKYNLYQIMYLEEYNTGMTSPTTDQAYKANPNWDEFLNSEGIKGVYVSVDTNGYVTWLKFDDKGKPAGAEKFAELAIAYAKDATHPINPLLTDGITAGADGKVQFSGLNLGYYLVDSTLGAICSLDNVNTDAIINEKNEAPSNEKEVQEDSAVDPDDPTAGYGKVNDADVGDTVNFRSTVTLPAGSENVVFHDTMSQGLSFTESNTIEVLTCTVTGEGNNVTITEGQALPAEHYTVNRNPEHQHGEGENAKNCTFTVTFDPTYLAALTETVTLRIKYSATITEAAITDTDGVENSSHLDYGDDNHTDPSTTKTYVWGFDVLKYANGDSTNHLQGAKFVLLREKATSTSDNPQFEVAVFNRNDTGNTNDIEWAELPTAGQSWNSDSVLTSDLNGHIDVDGLDRGTYYLREIEAPTGYDLLQGDVPVTIAPTTNGTGEGTTMTLSPITINVNNNSGTDLPGTGGIGTTIFYVVGSILLVGAVVLLITKKRMSVSK